MHKLGCMSRGTELDLIIISDRENMTNIPVCASLSVRESPCGFREHTLLLHTCSTQYSSTCGLHAYRESRVINKINYKKNYQRKEVSNASPQGRMNSEGVS